MDRSTIGRVEWEGHTYQDMPTFLNQYSADRSFREATRGVLETSPLTTAFFSADNQQIIQNNIRYQIFKRTNERFIISEQSPQELQIIMRSMFFTYGRNLPVKIEEQIDKLNSYVVDECVRIILPNLLQNETYKNDIATLPTPMHHPMNMSRAGTKSLPLKPFF